MPPEVYSGSSKDVTQPDPKTMTYAVTIKSFFWKFSITVTTDEWPVMSKPYGEVPYGQTLVFQQRPQEYEMEELYSSWLIEKWSCSTIYN
jgi:hypothetical protein